ncbi:hypothetical protein SAMN02745227_01423 [Anaerobranca californiensis DSM 14826]|jgi:hypothetical protein|uniref:Uncharacterized protein n=1 Tax=Anaerobranca californiensis DSM 14826 TaxID=1120989 RepID=A0A1M6PEC8_9FIRM|nr:hypothetical protein [Anaerobranca californiensis]SHK06250.1 hypothetical protein SAMN02745227_01423 [Anaerobranca californiensis DSM 14826]
MKDFLMNESVQMGIFFLLLVIIVTNFILKMYAIKMGIYKKVYGLWRINWRKIKEGLFLSGFAALFIYTIYHRWNFWLTIGSLIIYVGISKVLSGFFDIKSWKSKRYWD